MDKNSSTATIKSLSHDGRGITSQGQKTVFVSGALPSETVTYQICKRHERYDEAQLKSIVNPAPTRVTPPCPHFGVCGGCNLQHMSMSMQMKMKQQTLLEQLQHFGQVQPDHILAPLHAEEVGYRRKARLGVKFVYKKNKVLVGFREKSSRYLADLNECHTLHPAIGLKLNALSDLISRLSIKEHIPQIEVAIGDEDIALVFRHMQTLSDQDCQQLTHFGQANHMQIYLQPNNPAPITKLYPDDQHERISYSLPAYNLKFLFHPLDFTQINLPLNRLMVEQAIHLLELRDEDQVLDLFCGIGNFSLALARHAKFVVGVEGDGTMVARAQANAHYNHLQNIEFAVANLFTPNSSSKWLTAKYDKILLDPPRTGAKEIIPHLAQLGAKKILYVSCNPATLARDAGELVHQCGYRLTHAGIMNMFPHTAHTEAMALFEKT